MNTLCDRVAALLKAREGQWVDGRDIAAVGGYAAYRTRLSDLRRSPYAMQIDNRVRTVEVEPGRFVKISEYKFVPADQQTAVA